jgi:signal transduction histidine kinase
MADGPLLWRCVENMLSNVFKYSLPASRVYISVMEDGGSGLGLAIARSLMLAQGGGFDIKIDGDLFKATLSVPKCAAD